MSQVEMKAFFTDVFNYHHHFNRALISQLIEHEEKITERSIPLLSHAINAHQIWNARITGKEKLGVHEVHTLEECLRIDRDNYSDTVDILARRNLDEQVSYGNSKGQTFRNSVREILFHVANHFSHHKGQIISDIRGAGIDPIKTDYIFFKRQ